MRVYCEGAEIESRGSSRSGVSDAYGGLAESGEREGGEMSGRRRGPGGARVAVGARGFR